MARANVFDRIKMYYNRIRHLDGMSPEDYERALNAAVSYIGHFRWSNFYKLVSY